MPSNHLILCCPLLFLPSIFCSIRVFSSESVLCIRWPKSWSFSFSISPSNAHSGLVSFRMDWLDCLAAQGTLKSLLQLCSSKASILQCSAFFIVQLSHPYMITGKTIVAATVVQKSGREELPHVQGQGWWPRRATPRPKSGVEAERSYPTSKVRSSGCAFLEQL